jgi:starch synthase
MHIVQVGTEIAPMAKVGGLADVVAGLGRELRKRGHRVESVIPKYDCLSSDSASEAVCQGGVRSFFQGAWHENSIWRSDSENSSPIYWLESHHPSQFFSRGCIYGCHDDVDRFLYFSRAVIDWLVTRDSTPDIIHLHDWETAAIALLIRQDAFRQRFRNTAVVITLHNVAYQGMCCPADLDKIGLPGEWYDAPGRMQDDFQPALNLLKGGVVFSDHVVTVSPNYAREVLTPEGGKGLHPTLGKRIDAFTGILNGVDYAYWNPEIDTHLTSHYAPRPDALGGKRENKRRLLDMLGMPLEASRPLVIAVNRLVAQKGLDLIRHVLFTAGEKRCQFVLLGTAPDPERQWEFARLEERFRSDPHVRILLKQEEHLAHLLFAAADICLVPSLFEPCGLVQLIALKYGAIPVVRRTGGLADTIFDVDHADPASVPPPAVPNGFTFDQPDVRDMDYALDRAISLFRTHPARWQELVIRAMLCDFSWGIPASAYERVYEKVRT